MEVKGKRQAKSHNYKIHKSTQQASMEKQLYPIHFFFFVGGWWGVQISYELRITFRTTENGCKQRHKSFPVNKIRRLKDEMQMR